MSPLRRTVPAAAPARVPVPRARREPLPVFRALVVAGHPLVRDSLAARLRAAGASEVTLAASLADARRTIAAGRRDLAVVDLDLPEGGGYQLLAMLRSAGWPRVVVLADEDDPRAVRAAFTAGAQGYLLNSTAPRVVTDGVRRVMAGDRFADPALEPLLRSTYRSGARPSAVADLSARELEVLQLVSEGCSNRAVAEALGLSALTVKSHLARIARKLGTGDRAEMVAMVLRAGAID